MYHCQLRPPPLPILLISPYVHHRHPPSVPPPQALANITCYQSSTTLYPLECKAFSSPFKRNTSLSVEERDPAIVPAPATCKTYAMPWQTCLACPCYPFNSLLLINPPPLWQPYPKVNHVVTSRASPLQSPQSLQHGNICQNPKNHESSLTSGISRIQPIPSIDMVLRRPMNTGLTKQGRKPTIAQNVHRHRVPTLTHLP
jgi:hypothetical protein